MDDEKRQQAKRLAAQVLAKQYLAKQESAPSTQARNPVADFGSGANKTLISVAGFPVDITNKLLGMVGLGSEEPTLGTEHLTRLAEDYGFINKGLPENAPERAGKIFATAVPGIGVIGTAAKAKSLTAPIIEGFRTAPKAFAATEAISAGGAAIGGEIGRQQGDVGEVVGQIIGGIAAPTTISVVGKLPTVSLLRKAVRPFTKTGSKNVAAEVVQRGVKDRDLTISLANQADVLPNAELTLGGQAGSSRLLALEKAVVKKIPELADDIANSEAKTNLAVTKALESKGRISDTTRFFETQRLRLKTALNARMAGAVKKMDESVAKLKPDASRADASRVISNELEDALKDARFQEKDIWNNLPGDEKLSLTATRQIYDEIVTKETPLPSFVKDALKGKKVKIKDFKDVRELRSKMLRAQTMLRSQGNAEGAYVLQKLNEGILDDIYNTNLGDDFGLAVSFSRELNDKFTRGAVGKMMRFSPRGGRAVASELISEEIMSTSAAKAANAVRSVRAAVGSNDALESALLDSVKNKIFKDTGEINETALKRFVESKGELLNEFPKLKNQLLNANKDINAVKSLKTKIATAKVGIVDKRRSAAAILLDASPENKLNSILNSPNRRKLLSQAVRVTRRDEDAFAGLQDAYNKELFNQGLTARKDAFNNNLLSGTSMRSFFNSTKDDLLASGLYTKPEISRLNTIINTAERLEKQISARPEEAELVKSGVNFLEDFIIRVIGANIGAKFGGGTGATLVAAEAGSRAMRILVEKMPLGRVQKVLGEAVKNPELMKDLLTRTTNFEQKREAMKRLNAWIAALGPSEDEEQ